jgi:hypothetical protein
MTIQIRKIDVDSLSTTDPTDVPRWAKVTALIGGVEATLRLNEEQTARVIAATMPIVAEIGLQVADAMDRKVVDLRRDPAA